MKETEPFGGQESIRYKAFCPNCHRKWVLEDSTPEYEEQVINEIIPPENGEYQDDDGLWYYKDGTDME